MTEQIKSKLLIKKSYNNSMEIVHSVLEFTANS